MAVSRKGAAILLVIQFFARCPDVKIKSLIESFFSEFCFQSDKETYGDIWK